MQGRASHPAEDAGDHTCHGGPTCPRGMREAFVTAKDRGEVCACLLVFHRIYKEKKACIG